MVSFVDESDPDFEVKELVREIQDKAAAGHWKGATRKLKKLTRRYPNHPAITPELYMAVLTACQANRLQAARAAEPARKILEELWEAGYAIPEQAGNYCIQNSLSGSGPAGTHHGHGGIGKMMFGSMINFLPISRQQSHFDPLFHRYCLGHVGSVGRIRHDCVLGNVR